MRVLGVCVDDVSGWRGTGSNNRWAGLFRGLGQYVNVTEVIRAPRPPGLLLSRAVARAGRGEMSLFGAWSTIGFRTRSLLLEARLQPREGDYDLLFQVQTLHAPGVRSRPYVVCTDSTNALLERHDPTAGGLSREQAGRWQALEAEVARNALVVFAYSEFVRRSLIDDYGCSPESVVVSGGGSSVVLRETRDRSALPPRAVFVGYNFRRKGGLTLLEAWGAVEQRLPDAELVIAGPQESVPASLRKVRWVGRVNEATVADLYRDATVFVLPSLFEPFGLVLLEAMGNGLPVVASNCCAMPEIVEDGVTGLLVPPGDAAALAEALISLLGNPDQAAAMGRAGHAKTVALHTWDRVGERIARPLFALERSTV